MRIYLSVKKLEMISGKTFVFMKTSCVLGVSGVNAMNVLKVLEHQPSKTPVYYPCQLLFAEDTSGFGGFFGNFGPDETLLSLPSPRSSSSHAFYIYRQVEALEGKNFLFFCVYLGVTSIIKRSELSEVFSSNSYILSLSCIPSTPPGRWRSSGA